jgi:hypothetical protein
MEGTQTSLLVDIYQYLERNKKLGIEREELRFKELEQQNTAHNVTSNDNVDDIPNDHVRTTNDHVRTHKTIDGTPCDHVILGNDNTEKSCEEDERKYSENTVDDRSSRFIVSPVRDDTDILCSEINEETDEGFNIDDNLLTEAAEPKVDTISETNQLLNEADNVEGTVLYTIIL